VIKNILKFFVYSLLFIYTNNSYAMLGRLTRVAGRRDAPRLTPKNNPTPQSMPINQPPSALKKGE